MAQEVPGIAQIPVGGVLEEANPLASGVNQQLIPGKGEERTVHPRGTGAGRYLPGPAGRCPG